MGVLNGIGGPMSGAGGMNGGGPGGMRPGMGGPSGNIPPQQAQQAFQILNTPNHPIMRYLVQHVPGFESMPVQQQLHRVIYATKVSFRRSQMRCSVVAVHRTHNIFCC